MSDIEDPNAIGSAKLSWKLLHLSRMLHNFKRYQKIDQKSGPTKKLDAGRMKPGPWIWSDSNLGIHRSNGTGFSLSVASRESKMGNRLVLCVQVEHAHRLQTWEF